MILPARVEPLKSESLTSPRDGSAPAFNLGVYPSWVDKEDPSVPEFPSLVGALLYRDLRVSSRGGKLRH